MLFVVLYSPESRELMLGYHFLLPEAIACPP